MGTCFFFLVRNSGSSPAVALTAPLHLPLSRDSNWAFQTEQQHNAMWQTAQGLQLLICLSWKPNWKRKKERDHDGGVTNGGLSKTKWKMTMRILEQMVSLASRWSSETWHMGQKQQQSESILCVCSVDSHVLFVGVNMDTNKLHK